MDTRGGLTRTGLALVAALGAVVVLGILAVVSRSGDGDTATTDRVALVDPEVFAARMEDEDAFVVNVHVPYEGEIDGTDAFIPFDEIVGDLSLPADRDTELLVYCRSGRMSAIATAALAEAGYRNIVDLKGGMNAWEATGRPLTRAEP